MSTSLNNQKRGFFAITSTAAILGTFGVLIRALAESFNDTGQVLARSFFATIVIILVLLYKKYNPLEIKKSQIKYILAFSTVFPLSILSFTVSANSIKVSNSLFMLYVGSLLSTAFFGKVLFKEKFTVLHVVSLLLVFAGLNFFVHPFSVHNFSLGLLLGITAGLFEGASHTLRKLMSGIKREVVVFYQSLSGVVVALIFFAVSKEPLVTNFHSSSLIVALIFGILLVSIGYLLVYGFGNFDVNLGTIVLSTELFFALVINSLVLKETPTTYEILGGILIFSGTIVTSLKFTSFQKLFNSNARKK